MSTYLVAVAVAEDYLSLTAGEKISVVAPRQEIEDGRADYVAYAAIKGSDAQLVLVVIISCE